MGLLSIFQRNKQTAAKPAKSGRAGKAPVRQAPIANSMNPADAAEAVREARARARRRLMGATVLLLVGVIGFPLLFETQPRPIPVDLPIEIPARNAAGVAEISGPVVAHGGTSTTSTAAPATARGAEAVTDDARQASTSPVASAPTPAARPSAFASLAAALAPTAPRPSEAAASVAAPAPIGPSAPASSVAQSRAYINPAMRPGKHGAADAQASAVKPPTIALTPPKPASAPASHAAAAAHVTPPPQLPPPTSTATAPANSGAQAAALLAGNAAPKASDAAAGGSRFVVQIGAFADDVKMRDARGKVEKLGLKTYTQSVDTPGGKRVRLRVGPFPTKVEADRTASKIKSDGLPAAVLVL